MSNSSLPLNSLQKWMLDALIFPRQTSVQDAESIVSSTSQLTGSQRLAIYQRSYLLRLLKCLREQFPALCHALGEELFTDFTLQFLQAHPPESYTLYELGARFPDYLETTRPDGDLPPESRESWIDFMVELARFERRLFVMFDAPGHEGRPFAHELVPDSRLQLQPCFALRSDRFPVAWYYHEVRKGMKPPLPPQEKNFTALVRYDYLTHTIPLTDVQHTFLAALVDGATIENALEQVALRFELPIESVSQSWAVKDGIRKRWIEAGFFVERGRLESCSTS